MNCFTHIEETANGICKHCAKAICPKCAIDTKEGLACSEECVLEVKSYNLMMNKSKELYGIGKDGKKTPLTVIVYVLFTVAFLGIATYKSYTYNNIDYMSFILGIIFFIVGIVAYLRNKKLGTNF